MSPRALNMKTSPILFVLLLALTGGGCSWLPKAPHPAKPVPTVANPIVTPDFSLAAKVVSVNTVGRFVVLSFPASQMPKVEQTMFLDRGGLKVAEVRVTGPQSENDTVADLISGEAQVGDTVRDQ